MVLATHADSESEDEDDAPLPLTHHEEQARLREETIAAFHGGADDAEDGLFMLREKTQDELLAPS